MKKVVVTGADGFVGRELSASFKEKRGFRVVSLDSKKNLLFSPKTLRGLVKESDIIYHLASINDPKNPKIFKTNILGTWGVLEAVRRYSPSIRFIFASSFAVYKAPNQKIMIDENYSTIPRNFYGFTKLIAEKLCLFYSKLFGINIVITRISNIYGPGMPPFKHSVVSTFTEKIKKGGVIEISGNGEQTRDFVYIDDVIKALIAIGEKKAISGIFNICSGNSISLNKLVGLIERKFNRKIKRVYKGEVRSEYWVGNNGKAKKFLQWKPRRNFSI